MEVKMCIRDSDTECPVGERYSEAWIEDTAYKAIGQMLTPVSYTHLSFVQRLQCAIERFVTEPSTGKHTGHFTDKLINICLFYTSRCV